MSDGKKSGHNNVTKRIARETDAEPQHESDTQRIRSLIGRALDDEDWLRVIRRLARSNNIRTLELLMRYHFGLPVDAVQGPPKDFVHIYLPARDGLDDSPPSPQSTLL